MPTSNRRFRRVTRIPPPVEHLRNSALRLAAELDEARLYQAAAYVAMAADAMDSADEEAVNDNRPRPGAECGFELDEQDRVWMIRDGDWHIIGGKDAVRKEMWRFLRVLLPALR